MKTLLSRLVTVPVPGLRRLETLSIAPALLFLLASCASSGSSPGAGTPPRDVDYRAEMRAFVMDIAAYARSIDPDFLVVPQNGQELYTDTGEASGVPQTAYLGAIDGTGRESMFYGYYRDDEITPAEDSEHLKSLCALGELHGVEVLATDYCSTRAKMDDSYALNEAEGFISFAATDRNLATIPAYPAPIRGANANAVESLEGAKNFLYIINGAKYSDAASFVAAVDATDYDVIVMDLFQNESAFSPGQVSALGTKPSGARRLVLCYLSIGEAETYRYYWQESWKPGKPSWLEAENPDWEGNYKVRYWDPSWQSIIAGNDSSYLKKILDAGFDGVYLDIVDGFEYFEEK
jgi:cysteinyl-tRNA synthetase